MTFDHDFGYSFPLFSSLREKEGREKENEVAKILIKSHAFLLDRFKSATNKIGALKIRKNVGSLNFSFQYCNKKYSFTIHIHKICTTTDIFILSVHKID